MRKCGTCTACCVIPAVPELAKPPGFTCLHCDGKGCLIYEQRPPSCRNFECAWLQGEMPEWMRPDKVGVMVEKLPGGRTVLALGLSGRQWRTSKITEVLRRVYQQRGVAVLANDQLALLPEGRVQDDLMREVKQFARSVGAV